MEINIKKLIIICGAVLLFGVPQPKSYAKNPDKVSIFHADGTAFSVKPLVFEANVLPGEVFERGFYVVKKDSFDQILMMHFQRNLTAKENILARKIFVRLKRVSDGKFLWLPNGQTRMTLAGLYAYRDPRNSDAFRFDRISGANGSKWKYELIFEFSPRAGNRFQGRKTQFDLGVGIFSKPTGICSGCICFWRDFCCHPTEWQCRWAKWLF